MAKILVTDDEEDMRLALTNTLDLAGYAVVDADSGKAALELLSRQGVDLVLLDIRLPDMDGVQILQKIKELHPSLPVIMVTGFGSLETAVKCVKLGASDYVSKPFENKDLFQRIEKALGKKQVQAPPGPITSRLLEDLEARDLPTKVMSSLSDGARKPWNLRRALVWSLPALALGLAGALAVFWTGKRHSEYGVPTSHISGISSDGKHMWLSDWFSQTVFECRVKDDQLVVSRSFHLPDTRPAGLAWSGEALYLSDAWSRKLSKHALDANLSLVSGVKSPGKSPAGLYWDGQNLWSADADEDKVFRHAAGNLDMQRDLRAEGTAPVGVSVESGRIWIADADTRRLYQYRIEDYSLSHVYTHPLLSEATRPLSAFLILGSDAWLGFEGDNKIYRIKLRALEKVN